MLLVLKRMCMLYFKDLLYLFVVLFAIGVLTPKLFGRETLVFIYGFIVLVILAQFSFREYKTKQGRTAILLLPASNFEKYVAEILFHHVGISCRLGNSLFDRSHGRRFGFLESKYHHKRFELHVEAVARL